MGLIDIFMLIVGLVGSIIVILVFSGFFGGVLFRLRVPTVVNMVAAGLLLGGLTTMVIARIGDGLAWHVEDAGHGKAAEKKLAYLPESAVGAGSAASAGVVRKPKQAEPISAMLASADVALGKKTAKTCLTCHTFVKGGADKTGPALWGVLGRAMAAGENFAYSSALAGRSDEKWDYEAINRFIYKPKSFVPGTKMSYNGQKNHEKRAALIAWMRLQADDPLPLP